MTRMQKEQKREKMRKNQLIIMEFVQEKPNL